MKRLILLAPLLAVGCLERNEEITVKADGSCDVVLTYSGDPGDFNDLLVVPEGLKVEKGKDGDRTVWTARGTIREWSHRDPNFPVETRVRVTTRGDVRTYDFERTYPQMDAREIAAIDDAFWNRDDAKALLARMTEKGIAGLTDDEQRRLFDIAADAEREKQMAVVARAIRTREMTWRARVDALAKVEAEYREKLTGATLGAAIGKRLETVEKFDAFARSLRDRAAALVPGLGPALEEEAARMRASHAVSDDSFKLTVRMPGEIVAGNATRVDGASASWELPGKDLGSRPVVLRATSVERVK